MIWRNWKNYWHEIWIFGARISLQPSRDPMIFGVIPKNWLRDGLPYLIAVCAALVAGVVTSFSDFRFVAMLAAGSIGLVCALYPKLIFWMALLVAYVGAGVTQLYIPSLQLVRWAAVPLSMLMLLYVMFQAMKQLDDAEHKRNINFLTFLLVFFLLVNLFSALFNRMPFGDIFFGIKVYFQLWGIMFAMALLNWDDRMMRTSLPKFIFVIALIQLPFALHQYFFVAPKRVGIEKGIVALDIVSGTFGGILTGGGANAVLAVFLLSIWSCCLALWKKGYLSSVTTVGISIVLLIPVTINEAKVSIVYAMAIFFIVFRKGILQNFHRFLGVAVFVFAMVGGLFYTYVAHAPEGKADSWTELIAYTIEYNILKEEGFEGRLSRGGSIDLWVEDNARDVPHTLFGYGVGTTRIEARTGLSKHLGVADVQGFGVGNLASISVLWESGVIGFVVLTLIFIIAFIYAQKLEERCGNHDPWMGGIFLGLQGAVFILYISMWHKNFFVYHIGYQIIIVTLFGYLIYWRRNEDRLDAQVDDTSELPMIKVGA